MNEDITLDDAMLKQGYVTLQVAAKKMGRGISTVYRLVDQGVLKVELAGGRKYVSVKSCLEYLGPVASRALGLTAPKEK